MAHSGSLNGPSKNEVLRGNALLIDAPSACQLWGAGSSTELAVSISLQDGPLSPLGDFKALELLFSFCPQLPATAHIQEGVCSPSCDEPNACTSLVLSDCKLLEIGNSRKATALRTTANHEAFSSAGHKSIFRASTMAQLGKCLSCMSSS